MTRSLLSALLLAFTFGVSSPAGSTVIDVVVSDIGRSEGRLGDESDPLRVGDVVGIDFVLNQNPRPQSPLEDGYLLSSMDLDLVVTGSGWLTGPIMCKCGYIATAWHEDVDTGHPWGFHTTGSLHASDIDDNAYEGLAADSVNGVQGPAILFQGLGIVADAAGTIEVDLSVGGLTEYSLYGGWPGPGNPWHWIAATDADLGDLTLHVIPEPGTLALVLLGMGVLLFCRRSASRARPAEVPVSDFS